MQHSQDEETIDKRNCVREKITERLIYIYMILYYKILHTRMTFIRSIDCMHVHIAPASHFDFFIVLRSKIWPKLNLSTVWWTDRQFVDVLKHAEYHFENSNQQDHPDTRYVFYNSCQFYYLHYNCCLCYVPK